MILHQGILSLGFDFVSIIRYSYRHFTLIQRRPSYLPFTPPRCTIGFDMTVVTCGVVRAPEGRNLLCLPNAEHIPFAIFHRSLPRLSMRRIRQLRRRAAAAVAQHNLHANQGQNICACKRQRQRQRVIVHHPPGGGGGQLGCRTSSAACARRSNPSTSLPASAYRRRSSCPSRTRSTSVESDTCRSARYTPRWTMVLYPCTRP